MSWLFSLALAGVCYARQHVKRAWLLVDFVDGAERYRSDKIPYDWPASWSTDWWKPKTPRRDLVRAAALLIAEIERIDRKDRLERRDVRTRQHADLGAAGGGGYQRG